MFVLKITHDTYNPKFDYYGIAYFSGAFPGLFRYTFNIDKAIHYPNKREARLMGNFLEKEFDVEFEVVPI